MNKYTFIPGHGWYPPRKVDLYREDVLVATFAMHDVETALRYRDIFTHLLGQQKTYTLLSLCEAVDFDTEKPFNVVF